MTQQWYVVKHYNCHLTGSNCGDLLITGQRSAAPECCDCPTYLEWKKSGKTKKEFREYMESEL